MDRNTITSLIAVFISFLSLLISIFQSYLTKTHNTTSLLPNILITSHNDNNKLGLYMKNNGLGPAVVSNISVTVDGKSYNSNQNDFNYNLMKAQNSSLECSDYLFPSSTVYMKSGEIYPLIISNVDDNFIKNEMQMRFTLNDFLHKISEEELSTPHRSLTILIGLFNSALRKATCIENLLKSISRDDFEIKIDYQSIHGNDFIHRHKNNRSQYSYEKIREMQKEIEEFQNMINDLKGRYDPDLK